SPVPTAAPSRWWILGSMRLKSCSRSDRGLACAQAPEGRQLVAVGVSPRTSITDMNWKPRRGGTTRQKGKCIAFSQATMMIPPFGIRSIGAALVVLLLLSATTELRAAEPARHLILLPPRVELSSTEARQLLVAKGKGGGK